MLFIRQEPENVLEVKAPFWVVKLLVLALPGPEPCWALPAVCELCRNELVWNCAEQRLLSSAAVTET